VRWVLNWSICESGKQITTSNLVPPTKNIFKLFKHIPARMPQKAAAFYFSVVHTAKQLSVRRNCRVNTTFSTHARSLNPVFGVRLKKNFLGTYGYAAITAIRL
jgi:hypothetical protein